MQSTESHRLDGEFEEGVAAGRGWLGVAALLVWIGVGIYSEYRAVTVIPYTIALVGTAVGLTLLAALLGTGGASDRWSIPQSSRQSRMDQLLLVGCLVGLTIGTAGMVSAAGGVPTSQPRLADSAVIAGGLVVGSLFVLAGRWFGPVAAGLAVVGLAVAEVATPGSAVVTMVYDSRGIYGPLTRAAASWIAPACLVAGLWRASRVDRLLPTVGRVDSRWLTGQRVSRWLWVVTPPSMGFGAFLIAWLSGQASYLQVVGLAAIPAGGLWVGLFAAHRLTGVSIGVDDETRSETTAGWRGWLGPLLLAGGPLALMAVLLVWRRLPLGTVLVAGSLLLIGLCIFGSKLGIGSVDGDSHQLQTGLGTVLDGSVIGMGMFARVAVLLAVVGGLTSVLGTSTGLLSTVLWLSGGHTALVVLIGTLCCVALGLAVPVIGGYAVGALLIVPLLGTLTPIPELGAHLLVWYAVGVGWLLGPAVGQRLRRLGWRQRLGAIVDRK